MRLIDADAFDERVRVAGGMSEEELTEDFKDGVQAVLYMLSNQPTIQPEPHWIPVTERLPEELELVIMTVYRTDKSYNQRPYIRIGFRRSEMWYPIPQESAPFERNLSSYDGGNPVVTAWMPLSEPYQKGEQDDR